jgi:hypothetical protein
VVQFGLDRGSNVYELEYARYDFRVAYDAFVVHRGFKEASLLHATRLTELLDNRTLFLRYFLPGLVKKYPHIVNGTTYFPGQFPRNFTGNLLPSTPLATLDWK